jgi:hypothetical protein
MMMWMMIFNALRVNVHLFRQSAKYCSVLKSLCLKCHQAYKNVQHLQIDDSLDDNNESPTNTSIVEEEGNKVILK